MMLDRVVKVINYAVIYSFKLLRSVTAIKKKNEGGGEERKRKKRELYVFNFAFNSNGYIRDGSPKYIVRYRTLDVGMRVYPLSLKGTTAHMP